MDRATFEQLDRIEETQGEILDKIQMIMEKLEIVEEVDKEFSDDEIDDF